MTGWTALEGWAITAVCIALAAAMIWLGWDFHRDGHPLDVVLYAMAAVMLFVAGLTVWQLVTR